VRRRFSLGPSSLLAQFLVAVVLLAGCSTSGRELKTPGPTRPPSAVISAGTMDFSLPDATATGQLAEEHGGDFANVAPPLSWGRVPSKAKYLIVVADVPRADSGTADDSVLWLVANIDASTDGLIADQAPPGEVYRGWNGPTVGPNQQVKVRFRLYAVTQALSDPNESPLEIVVRLDKQNVGKSEFSVPFVAKTTS